LKLLVEIIGWTGAVLLVVAYGLLSTSKLDSRSIVYHSMNVLGSLGFIINSGYNGAYPSVGLNVIWIGIGIYGLIKYRPSAKTK
jgi:hypothetical protein